MAHGAHSLAEMLSVSTVFEGSLISLNEGARGRASLKQLR
jgi:hypothetical protein